MPVAPDDLLKQALTLSEESKLFLAEELVASVHSYTAFPVG